MAAALLNHAIMSAQPQAGTRVSPMASASSNTTNDASSTASTSAGITANDFLTLSGDRDEEPGSHREYRSQRVHQSTRKRE